MLDMKIKLNFKRIFHNSKMDKKTSDVNKKTDDTKKLIKHIKKENN